MDLDADFILGQIDHILVFTQQRIEEHQKQIRKKGKVTGPPAMLEKYLDAHNEKPEWFTYNDVLMAPLTGIVAGGDTTEISLGALFHYLHEHAKEFENLPAKVDKADLSDPVKYSEAKKLLYLHAALKETQRMHSSVGTPLWRTVPKQGMTLSGRFPAERTTVGVKI